MSQLDNGRADALGGLVVSGGGGTAPSSAAARGGEPVEIASPAAPASPGAAGAAWPDEPPPLAERLATSRAFALSLPERDRLARGVDLSLASGLDPETATELGPRLTDPGVDFEAMWQGAPTYAAALGGDGRLMLAAVPDIPQLWRQEERLRDWNARRPGEPLAQERFGWLEATLGSLWMGIKDVRGATARLGEEGLAGARALMDRLGLEGPDDALRARMETALNAVKKRYFPELPELSVEASYDEDKANASGLRGFVADVARSIPNTAASVSGAALAGAAGAALAGGSLIYGMSLEQYDKDPAITDPERKRLAALFNAVLQSGLEGAGAAGIARGFHPASAWGKAFRTWLTGGAKEGGTEYLQEYADTFALSYARGSNPAEREDLKQLLNLYASADWQKQALYSGAVGLAAGGAFGAAGLAGNRRYYARQEAALALAPALARTHPHAYRELLRTQIAAGNASKDVFVPSARIEGLFQDATSQDRADFLRKAGIAEADYEAALASGAALAIPFEHIHEVLGDERGKALADAVTLSPEQETAGAEAVFELFRRQREAAAETAVADEGDEGLLAEADLAGLGPDELAALQRLEEDTGLDAAAAEERAALRQEVTEGLLAATRQGEAPYTAAEARAYADIIDAMAATYSRTAGTTIRGGYDLLAPLFAGGAVTAPEMAGLKARAREGAGSAEALARDPARVENRPRERESGAPFVPLAERAPLLALVRGRLDAKSLRRDYPGVYKELQQRHGRGLFRSREKGGIAIDELADEAVTRGLLETGAGANELVDALMGNGRGTLYQPANAGVDPDRVVEAVQVPTEPSVPLWIHTKGTGKKALVRDITGTLRNRDTGATYELSGKNAEHLVNSAVRRGMGGLAHIAAVRNVRPLVESAVLIESHADRKSQEDVRAIHHLFAPMLYDGKVYTVHFVGKEYEGGRRLELEGLRKLYDLQVEKDMPAAILGQGPFPAGSPAGGLASRRATRSLTVRQMLEGVKDSLDRPYYQGLAANPRAVVSFVDGAKSIIRFLGSADISSAGHEIGHVLRRVLELSAGMEDMPSYVRRDWEAACRFVGAKPGEAWTRAQEEKFADAFIGYLVAGSAPSTALSRAFNQLKRWLLDLYRRIGDRPGIVSPEMRGVFDRLLATEAEIEAAKARTGLGAMTTGLEDLPAAFFGDEERKALAEAVADADAAAAAAVQKRLTGELRRAQAAWRKEGAAVADADPDQVRLDALIEGGGLTLGPDMEARYGAEAIRAIRGKRPGKTVLSRDGGLAPELVADDWGFAGPSAVDDLMARLTELPTKKAIAARYVADMTEAWTRAWAPDEVILTEQAAKVLGLEAEALARAVGEKAVDGAALRKVVAGRVRGLEIGRVERAMDSLKTAARENAVAARQAARARLDRELEKQRDRYEARLETLREYQREERDRMALMYKERQRRAVAEIRARAAAAEMRRKGVAEIARALRAPAGAMDEVWHEQIRALAQRFGLGGKRTAPRNPGALEPLDAFLARVQEDYDDPVPVPGWLAAYPARGGNWKTLTVGQFAELRDLFRWMNHQGRTLRAITLGREKADVADVVNAMITSMDSLQSRKPIADYERRQLGRKRFVNVARRALAEITQLEYAFKAADGYRAGVSEQEGPHVKYIVQPLYAARSAELALFGEAKARLDALMEPVRRRKDRARRWDLPAVPLPQRARAEWGALPWNYERVLMVALNMGNQGNRNALRKGYGWSDNDLETITASLTREDWAMVQGIWDLVDSLYRPVNEAYRQISGLSMRKVEAANVETPYGVLKGGYFPLVFDGRLSDRAAAWKEEDDLLNARAAVVRQVKASDGFTKDRKGGVLPPRLDMGVLLQHVQMSAHYATHAVPLRNIRKIVGSGSFRRAIADKFGDAMYEQIQPWLNNIARPERPLMTTWEKSVEWARHMATIQALGLRLTSSLMQLTSITASAQEIGYKAVGEGLAYLAKNRGDAYRVIRQLSPMMRDRARSLDRDLSLNLTKFNPDRRPLTWTWGGKAHEFVWSDVETAIFAPMQMTDSIVAYSTWWGAYQKALRETQGDQKRAVLYADRAVTLAQAAGHGVNLSNLQQRTGVAKLLTMFMTYTMNLQNRIRFQTRGVLEGNISPARYMRYVFNDIVAPSVISLLLTSLLKSGDVPDDPAEYAKEIGYYLLSGFPLLRDTQSFFEYGGSINAINPTVSQGLTAPWGLGKAAYKAFTAEPEKRGDAYELFLKKSLEAAGFAFGVPARPIWQFIDGARDIANGETDNPFALFVKQDKPKTAEK